jgi:hypothetical protein
MRVWESIVRMVGPARREISRPWWTVRSDRTVGRLAGGEVAVDMDGGG